MIRAARAAASFLALAIQIARLSPADAHQMTVSADAFVRTTQAFVTDPGLWSTELDRPAPALKPSGR